MDFKAHLEKAWHLILNHLGPLILETLVLMVVGFLSMGILALPTSAGYIQSIILMLREGREPRIQDIFSEMRLFLPLLGFSIVAFIASMIGFMLFFLPGLAIILAITFACLYMLPLMSDRRLGLMEAIKTSWRMAVSGNVADHIVVVILYVGLIAIGGSVFIGALFTVPFATVFLASVYLERVGKGDVAPPPEKNPVP